MNLKPFKLVFVNLLRSEFHRLWSTKVSSMAIPLRSANEDQNAVGEELPPPPPQSSTTSIYFVAKGQKISLFPIALITFKALQRVLFSCAPTVHVSFDFDIMLLFS